jgi:Carboxypeptidase regulatory-like domain
MSDSNGGSTNKQPASSPSHTVDEQTTGRCKGRRFAYAIAVMVATVVGISLFSDLPESPGNLGDWSSWLLQNFTLTLLAFILLTGVITFVEIFACPLPDDRDETADGKESPEIRKLKQRWMTFAYGFMLFALFAAVIPFLFDIRPSGAAALKQSPIAVLVGCAEKSNGIPGELHCAQSDAKENTGEVSAERKPEAEINSGMWVINLGGEVTSCKPSGSDGPVSCRIQGGLVVPVYLVMLALFGGAVSLTRRVPEYQKQAADDYVATENAPKLRPHRLREYLIFQMVQFISAPFVAVVAYYVVAPTAMSATVALGFAAGFASEAVLLMIRAAVDKIKPAALREPSTGSVSGYVTDEQDQVIEGAEVQILDVEGKPTESTDATGCFVLNEIPAGEHALKVRHTETKKARIEQIRIPSGAAVVCKLTL